MLAVLPLCMTFSILASVEYSAGMTSYMNSDFEAAQRQWLKAADLNDPKAMFNLGLLHERQRISGASEARADHWFRSAGDAGYAPADYHLARRLQLRGLDAESDALLRRAAASGFLLAQEQLGIQPQPQANRQESGIAKELTKQRPESSVSQVDSRNYQGERWILAQLSGAWTIQMLAFSEEAKVRNFIDDHGLHRNAAYFLDRSQSTPLFKLIYGAYATKQEADAARSGFTSQLKEHGPWLRPIKGVQAIIKGG